MRAVERSGARVPGLRGVRDVTVIPGVRACVGVLDVSVSPGWRGCYRRNMVWAWFRKRRYRAVSDLGALGGGDVELFGTVEALDVLHDPLHGEACVAMQYRAWAPTAVLGMSGSTGGQRGFQLEANQAVDFVLVGARGRVMIRAGHHDDVCNVHETLLARFGIGLRSELSLVRPGERLRVRGAVRHTTVRSSPHRAVDYQAIVEAHDLWRADE